MKWNEVQAYARHILYTKYKDYNDELLGESFIAYTKALETFDPLKASFLTHFKYTLLGHLSDYHKYNDNLIHIPRNKLADVEHKYIGFDSPIGDTSNAMTFGDTIAYAPQSTDDDLVAWILDQLTSMYPHASKPVQSAIKALKHNVISGEPIPRKLRTQVCNLRIELRNRYVKYVMENNK